MYNEIIREFFSKEENRNIENLFRDLTKMVTVLKDAGLSNQDWTQDLIDTIADCLLNKDVKEFYKVRFGYYLTYYLQTICAFKIPDKTKAKTGIDSLKPTDFKAKQYDEELLALLKGEDNVRE